MAIEIKKNPQVDLNSKRGLIFSISMVITLSLVLYAFEWKQYDQSVVKLTSKQTNVFETMIEVPSTVIPPPPEVIIQQPQLVAVPDEEEVEQEIKFIFDVEFGLKINFISSSLPHSSCCHSPRERRGAGGRRGDRS